jgi:hypothetical protein
MSIALVQRGSTDLVEQPGSPAWEISEKSKCTRVFKGPWTSCQAAVPMFGSWGTGDQNWLRVSSCTLVKERGEGILTITWEGASGNGQTQALPADECSVDMEKQEYALEKHDRYATLGTDFLEGVRSYIDGSTPETRAKFQSKVDSDALAAELADKLQHGQTNFIVYLPVYQWVTHSWLPPAASIGGSRETPYGPITPPAGLEWLRQGDKLSWNGTSWALTRSWIGSRIVDTDLYPPW